jgi:hypothetical protein
VALPTTGTPRAPDDLGLRDAAGWSKGKTGGRAKAARTLEAVEQARAEALAAITRQDAHGWCAHAGYCMASN